MKQTLIILVAVLALLGCGSDYPFGSTEPQGGGLGGQYEGGGYGEGGSASSAGGAYVGGGGTGGPAGPGPASSSSSSSSSTSSGMGGSCTPGQSMANQTQFSASPVAMAVADFDGDGWTDVVVGRDGPNRLYFNTGSGLLDSGTTIGDAWTLGIATGDLNNDGHVDLVEANYSGQTNKVWLGDGTGNFIGAGVAGYGESTYDAVLGDINQDGYLDVVTVNESAQGLRLRYGDGTGHFGAHTTVALPPINTWHTVVLGDWDNDGDLDAAVAGSNDPVAILLNNSGALVQSGPFLQTEARALAAADLNGDGYLDLVAGTSGSSIMSPIFLGNGDGTFSPGVSLSLGSVRTIDLQDIDGDGDVDLFAGNTAGSTTNDSIWLNDGPGTFTKRVEPGLSVLDTRGVALLALDADCDLDAVAATGDTLSTWLNQ